MGCSKKELLLMHETKKGNLTMSEIQNGDRVRILQNQDIPRHLRNRLGIIIEIQKCRFSKEEAMVKLDSGGRIYVMKRDLRKVD